jgi:hypothetical protein
MHVMGINSSLVSYEACVGKAMSFKDEHTSLLNTNDKIVFDARVSRFIAA